MNLITIVISALAFMVFPCSASETKQPTNERILLIHAVPASNSKTVEQAAINSVYDGIIERLTDKGYRVVDKTAAEKCSQEIAATHDIDPFLNKAASYGLKFFAEYTLFFRTSTITKDNDNGMGAMVRVNAKLVDNTSSRIITSKAAEASSSGLTLENAIDKAGRSTGKKLGSLLIGSMDKFYQESDSRGRTYTIVIENYAADVNTNNLLSRLEHNALVSAAKEIEAGGGKVTFEINYKGKRDQLDRDILKYSEELGLKLQKIRSEGNRSSWKIQNQGGSQ